jgi:hypothetical protein
MMRGKGGVQPKTAAHLLSTWIKFMASKLRIKLIQFDLQIIYQHEGIFFRLL